MDIDDEITQLRARVAALEGLMAQQVKVNKGLVEQLEGQMKIEDLHYGASMNSAHFARALASAALAHGQGTSPLDAFTAVRDEFREILPDHFLPGAWGQAPDWLVAAMRKDDGE